MRIGHRTLKTGIAVTLSLVAANLLKLDGPIYAAIAAIIVMQPSVFDSWEKGVYRILGTIMGAIMGAIFLGISPGNPILAGIGIIIFIMIMNKLKWGDSIVIGTVVFIGIFLDADVEYVRYAFHRTMDTSIGIIVAVIVNYIIYPPDYYRRVMEESEKNLTDVLKYSIRSLEVLLYDDEDKINILEGQIDRLEEVINTSERLLEIQEKEKRMMPEGDLKYRKMEISHNLEKEIFQHLQNIQEVLEKGIKVEVIDIVRDDLKEINNCLMSLHTREKKLLDTDKNGNQDLNLKTIVTRLKVAKNSIKNHEEINDYSTDEVIKMLVFLYNLEELLLKLDNISN